MKNVNISLDLAVKRGNIEQVKQALQEERLTPKNNSLLLIAASDGCYDIVSCLLEHGADCKVQDERNLSTPLHHAVYKACSPKGCTLLSVNDASALISARYHQAPILIKEGNEFSIYGYQEGKWRKRNLENLNIDEREILNALNFKYTELRSTDIPRPLAKILGKGHNASEIYQNNLNMIKILLDYGADYTVKNIDGKTPLERAKTNPDVYKKFLEFIGQESTAECKENLPSTLHRRNTTPFWDSGASSSSSASSSEAAPLLRKSTQSSESAPSSEQRSCSIM